MSASGSIGRDEMMEPMLAACPSLARRWEEFLREWVDNPTLVEGGGDGSLPVYLALSELANHLIVKLETNDTHDFPAIFNVVEQWITRGTHYVSEAAVVGLLEDLTNEGRYFKARPAEFVNWMGPQSRKSWAEVIDFWKRMDEGKFGALPID